VLVVWTRTYLLWLVRLLWRFEPYLSICLCIVESYAYLSMYDYVMIIVVVPC
jgi:hypothetical protein